MIRRILRDDVEDVGSYIAEVIYGANDGIVTTFAVVAGVAGAALDPPIVLILGIANLFADGFSMGASNYLSQRSTQDYEAAKGRFQATRPPRFTAITTFLAFVIAGWTPLLPYVLEIQFGVDLAGASTFSISLIAAAFAFFVVGSTRSLVTDRSWYRAGGEMLAVGMIAASVAYAVGTLLGGLA